VWQLRKEDLEVSNPPNCKLCRERLKKIGEPYNYEYYNMKKTSGLLFWKKDKYINQVCERCKNRLVSEGWIAERHDGYWGGSPIPIR
jgi:hypothetical protein